MMWARSGCYLAALVLGHALLGCASDTKSPSSSDGSGGSGGSGGTDGCRTGTRCVDPGTGGAEPGTGGNPGTGGSEPGTGGHAGTGGTAAGPGGSGGEAGAGEAGASGAGGEGGASECAAVCDACDTPFVLADCSGDACICEPPDQTNKDAQLALSSCELPTPCPDSSLNETPGSIFWENGECLLAGLRDRQAGRYRFSSTFSDAGSMTTQYELLVDGTDQVLVLTTTESSLVWGNVTRQYWPVERCTLKSYEALEACIDAGTQVSPTTTAGAQAEAVCETLQDWVDECQVVGDAECPVVE